MHSNRNRKRPRSSWMSPEIRNRSQSSRPSCRQQVSNPRSQDQSKRFQGSPRTCDCSTNAASVCQGRSTAMENRASLSITKVLKPQSVARTNTVASVKVVCTTSANIKQPYVCEIPCLALCGYIEAFSRQHYLYICCL